MDAALRDLVRERAGNRCEYCWLSQTYAPLVHFWIKHIIARQHGGTDDPENLALACPLCNGYKGPNLTAIDSQSGAIVPLFHPRMQRWRDYFTLEGVYIVGRTSTGRATVRLLRMNTDARLDIRAHLQALGELADFDED